jgi:ElaB/YqjD/DUF883 family membrane-anchored ribosome-binding protein
MASTTASSVKNAADDASSEAKSFVNRAADAATDAFDDAADFVTDKVRRATNASSDAGTWLGDQIDMLRDRVQEEPIKALAITAGIGALLGAVFLRR